MSKDKYPSIVFKPFFPEAIVFIILQTRIWGISPDIPQF